MVDTGDKIEAGAKAVAKKVKDLPRDLDRAYNAEKAAEDTKDVVTKGYADDSDKAGNSVEAAGKAVSDRIENAGRELKTEYNKEKAKEVLD